MTGRDTIWDFATGEDKLDFSGFLDPMGNALGQSFTIGTLQAGGGPRIQINANAGDYFHHLLADYNGDGIADFEVLIRPGNASGLPAIGDFIL
ncbi:MAG: hypothetical protein HC777_03085 [Hyphomonadaceae bacterium]|nr:hypothetical protein [Hyphomonadaceae bacterium]